MPRDYKHRARRKKKRAKLSPWTGVIGGLLIGLFVAFLVYIKMQAKPDPHVYLQESIQPPAEAVRQEAPAESNDQADVTPTTPKPRFDFYTLLPEMEVVVPEQEISAGLKQTAPPVQKAAPVEEASPAAPGKPPKQAVPAAAKPACKSAHFVTGHRRNASRQNWHCKACKPASRRSPSTTRTLTTVSASAPSAISAHWTRRARH